MIAEKDSFKASRTAYIISVALTYFIQILNGGAYFAKLTTSLGISDGLTAVLTTFNMLSFVFQLVSIPLAAKSTAKSWVVPFSFLSTASLAFIYLVPTLRINKHVALIIVGALLLSKATISIVTPLKMNWFFSMVDNSERSVFQAVVSLVSSITGTVFTLGLGAFYDYFDKNQRLEQAFLFVSVGIFVMALLDMLLMLLSKEKPKKNEEKSKIREHVNFLFHDKPFRKMLILYGLWHCATFVIIPFTGTYQIKELGFSLGYVSVITSVTNVFQILVLFALTKVSKRYSNTQIFGAAWPVAIAAFFILAVSNRDNGHITYLLYMLLHALYAQMHTVSYNNMIYDIVPMDKRVAAFSVVNVVVGIASFLTTLLVSPLYDYVQQQRIFLFGKEIYAQQIASLVCTLSVILLSVYYFKRCKKDFDQERTIYSGDV
ncbi:MAG: MFS transporter [Ruminococcaceae bacterium]|nr:MFS transporter [Oscillospiraceae bacterium]